MPDFAIVRDTSGNLVLAETNQKCLTIDKSGPKSVQVIDFNNLTCLNTTPQYILFTIDPKVGFFVLKESDSYSQSDLSTPPTPPTSSNPGYWPTSPYRSLSKQEILIKYANDKPIAFNMKMKDADTGQYIYLDPLIKNGTPPSQASHLTLCVALALALALGAFFTGRYLNRRT